MIMSDAWHCRYHIIQNITVAIDGITKSQLLNLDGREQRCTKGNKEEYNLKVYDALANRFHDGRPLSPTWHNMNSLDSMTIQSLSKFCSLSQTYAYAGRADVARTVLGGPSTQGFGEEDEMPSLLKFS